MKIRIQRIKRSKNYNHHGIDVRLVEGTIKQLPKRGDQMHIQFARLDAGTWTTTPVDRVQWDGDELLIHTINSTYKLVKGWEEDK